jgi:hypothetical protein
MMFFLQRFYLMASNLFMCCLGLNQRQASLPISISLPYLPMSIYMQGSRASSEYMTIAIKPLLGLENTCEEKRPTFLPQQIMSHNPQFKEKGNPNQQKPTPLEL